MRPHTVLKKIASASEILHSQTEDKDKGLFTVRFLSFSD
jgi:hypothetical protein